MGKNKGTKYIEGNGENVLHTLLQANVFLCNEHFFRVKSRLLSLKSRKKET